MSDKITDFNDFKKRKEDNGDEYWACPCGCVEFWLLGNGEFQCIDCRKRVAGYWVIDDEQNH